MDRPLDARELHHALAGRWPDILVTLGIDREHLRNRHGPCPVCGGKDRFRFDDKDGRGTWICTHCGAGDGFKLLQLAFGWDFPRTCREVAEAAGLQGQNVPTSGRSQCEKKNTELNFFPRNLQHPPPASAPCADPLRRSPTWPTS